MSPTYPHRHTPPQRVSTRVRCPVCHEEVYSRAGIHPQCAVRQCDPPRVKTGAQTSPPGAGPVSAAIEAAGAVVIPKPPAAMRIFDPDRTAV